MLVDAPFKPQGRIGYQSIKGGYYGVLTHAGPYSTLASAYQELFHSALATRDFMIDSGCVFELLLDSSATSNDDYTWTEIYIPLRKKGRVK